MQSPSDTPLATWNRPQGKCVCHSNQYKAIHLPKLSHPDAHLKLWLHANSGAASGFADVPNGAVAN